MTSKKPARQTEPAIGHLVSLDPSAYNDPKHEGLLREINSLSAVVRRRNEQIADQVKQINELRRQMKEREATRTVEVEQYPLAGALRELADIIDEADQEQARCECC